ncbi:MAG: F0F1 ATP synthase subunit delta [Patescibacteria group bacterium]
MKRVSPGQLARQLFKALESSQEQDLVIQVFAEQLVRHRLRRHLPQILRALETLLDEKEGLVKAKFTSPVEVTNHLKKQVEQAVSQAVGKRVELETHQDQDLLGGAVLKIGDTVYDASIRTQLAKLKLSVENYG